MFAAWTMGGGGPRCASTHRDKTQQPLSTAHGRRLFWCGLVTVGWLAVAAQPAPRHPAEGRSHSPCSKYRLTSSMMALITSPLSQHNRHHAMPQKEGADPDLNTLPLVAFTAKVRCPWYCLTAPRRLHRKGAACRCLCHCPASLPLRRLAPALSPPSP